MRKMNMTCLLEEECFSRKPRGRPSPLPSHPLHPQGRLRGATLVYDNIISTLPRPLHHHSLTEARSRKCQYYCHHKTSNDSF
ncbi:hypothetical protein QVD17_10991 [Tagetes erecta]|uniref:Uncharacterized protein n=1 Tax=Tagetes erecta TaxID=13708 RepID=A0AAD8P5A5_TARER|nr:hypothetical protein QVD17_10991 [Tagetes erecta]